DPMRRRLEEDLRPFGFIDTVVEVSAAGALRFFHPRRAAAEIRDACGPHFLALDRCAEARFVGGRHLRRGRDCAENQTRGLVRREDRIEADGPRRSPIAAFGFDDEAVVRRKDFYHFYISP